MRIDVTPTLSISSREFSEHFVRASGPGGQNVNKVASAVELRFHVADSSLPDDVKARLLKMGGNRITAEGDLLIDSRAYRTQAQNREEARKRLVKFIRLAAIRPKKRRKVGISKASKELRLIAKHHRAALKRERHMVE